MNINFVLRFRELVDKHYVDLITLPTSAFVDGIKLRKLVLVTDEGKELNMVLHDGGNTPVLSIRNGSAITVEYELQEREHELLEKIIGIKECTFSFEPLSKRPVEISCILQTKIFNGSQVRYFNSAMEGKMSESKVVHDGTYRATYTERDIRITSINFAIAYERNAISNLFHRKIANILPDFITGIDEYGRPLKEPSGWSLMAEVCRGTVCRDEVGVLFMTGMEEFRLETASLGNAIRIIKEADAIGLDLWDNGGFEKVYRLRDRIEFAIKRSDGTIEQITRPVVYKFHKAEAAD